ncbi:MAG: AraC family transcriptional regulator [Lachnospiraceae bacterium]|nr:AraC family transcriptional regulator [Lachnospiraceae bacterium]
MGNADFAHYYMHLYEWPGASAGLFNEYDFLQEVSSRQGDKEIFKMLVNIFPENQLQISDPKIYDNDDELNTSCCNFTQRPPCERMLAKGSMLVLISRFMNPNVNGKINRNPKIVKVCRYITTHLADELSLHQLSEQACMSESHFLRVFKKEMGATPIQYIIQRRIEAAQLLLLLNDQPLKTIADSLGFSDSSHFVKTFKKSNGSTVPCGVVTNYHLASVQRGDTINPNAADYCDYLIAKDILESLSSNNQGGYNFLNFNGAVYNPIGMVCSSFSNTYNCPGVIVVYDAEGNIVMLEYYKENVLIHFEDGEFNVSTSTTFTGTDRIQ